MQRLQTDSPSSAKTRTAEETASPKSVDHQVRGSELRGIEKEEVENKTESAVHAQCHPKCGN